MTLDFTNLRPFDLGSDSEIGILITGSWSSLMGSEMEISAVSGNNFSGTYTSSVSGGCLPITGPLTGTISGGALGFLVNWSPTYSSVTSWSGLLLDDGSSTPIIYTLWDLATMPPTEDQWWESIQAGTDFFLSNSS